MLFSILIFKEELTDDFCTQLTYIHRQKENYILSLGNVNEVDVMKNVLRQYSKWAVSDDCFKISNTNYLLTSMQKPTADANRK